ncbi:MAG: galactose-1-phosphate uridylyltransferase [Firmicutes bacterium]|nr:galactose-1-phosphate uridylyltransferase [Bacillota bacterium]MDD4693702.1 galactose-1-phosphate uridylyltransferase [Bacillota bacterium]
MAELRYNPLLDDWTMVAASRQKRPDMPKDYCPFCPGSGKVPELYDVFLYHNDFPVLSKSPPTPDDVAGGIYKVRESRGKCEVVLYSPDHYATIPDLSKGHILKLIDLWRDTYKDLVKEKEHEYVMIFENRGKEVGVTMPHPHGQIYAYPFIPLKVRTEIENAKAHFESTGRNLFADMLNEERRFGERIVYENEHFVVFIPFFTDYPFGTFVLPKRQVLDLTELTKAEEESLAVLLKELVGGMDRIYDRLFPYMMVMHPAPHKTKKDAKNYYWFHIEFYPPLRGERSVKYNASSETGGWAAANPTKVEDNAVIFKEAIERYKRSDR